ncbi:MAG: hypothetical protein REI78_06935 [Pedobacter sp.]|nr:hypothetical protein [Pedobacter sp.]MDQ8052742.1 hypothetical protein [Pedobacter sp.]
MKKLTLVLLAVSFTSAFISCKKDKETTSDSATVTVNASLLGFDGTSGTAFKSTAGKVTKSGNSYTLTAVEDGAKRSISITVNNVTALGTFTLDKGNTSTNMGILVKDNTSTDATLTYKTDGVSTTGGIGGGSLQITKLTDTEIEGKFYVVAYNSAKVAAFVENGAFSGKITK